MDLLTTVEPQLAIPVVGVVVCALLVYIFGFQQTQEPSFEHLAVLQSSTKSSKAVNGLRQRSSTPQVKPATKAKEKVVANGHAVQEKPSPKANGVVKSPKVVKEVVNNKENVKPVKKTKTPPTEDFNEGDWIQAPSRKDRKNKVEKSKKDSPSPPSNRVENSVSKKDADATQTEETPVSVAKVAENSPKGKKEKPKQTEKVVAPAPQPPAQPEKVLRIEEVLAQFKQQELAAAAAKAGKPLPVVTPIPASAPAPAPAAPAKEAPVQKVKESAAAEPKTTVAFDEMGDTWEEAKSRGTKKRRARKD